MSQTVVLKTEGLTKRFGDFVAVDGLSLEVYEGAAGRARANPDRTVSNAYWRWLTTQGGVPDTGTYRSGRGIASLDGVRSGCPAGNTGMKRQRMEWS